MANVPINRTGALIICACPQDDAPARLREAARYLLDRRDATEEEQRLAPEATEWLRSKQDNPKAPERDDVRSEDIATPDRRPAPKPKRKR